MKILQELELRLKTIEAEIREAEKRLPAHSTKPGTMMMLLELEDERDDILKKVKTAKNGAPQKSPPADSTKS